MGYSWRAPSGPATQALVLPRYYLSGANIHLCDLKCQTISDNRRLYPNNGLDLILHIGETLPCPQVELREDAHAVPDLEDIFRPAD
jgi:hypothetical protein